MEALGARCTRSPSRTRSAVSSPRVCKHVRELCASDERYVWLNQYSNDDAWKAHYRTTAPAIARAVPGPGRAVRRRRHGRDPDGLRPLVPQPPPVRADRRGRPRRLGELRCARRRAGCSPASAWRAVRRCSTSRSSTRSSTSRRPTRSAPVTGWPGAGSCSAARPAPSSAARCSWLAAHDAEDVTAVALAPDLGERYLDTIYQSNWVRTSTATTSSAPIRSPLPRADAPAVGLPPA